MLTWGSVVVIQLIMRVVPSATFQPSSLPSDFQMKSYSEHIQVETAQCCVNIITVMRDYHDIEPPVIWMHQRVSWFWACELHSTDTVDAHTIGYGTVFQLAFPSVTWDICQAICQLFAKTKTFAKAISEQRHLLGQPQQSKIILVPETGLEIHSR